MYTTFPINLCFSWKQHWTSCTNPTSKLSPRGESPGRKNQLRSFLVVGLKKATSRFTHEKPVTMFIERA